jgi:carbon monoxide dehydrogenase subunit G
MPGAQLLGVEGEEYRGSVKIKAGPVSAGYTGVARFVERNEVARRAVIRAEGRDTGGQGNAAATVTAVLTEQGQATLVSVTTQLSLSGRVAQFGRGVIADVSGKLLGQFVQRLEAAVAQSGAAQPEGVDAFNVNGAAPAAASEVSGGSGTADAVEPLDLMDGMGGVLLRRALPAAGALAAVVALIALLASVLG